MLLLLFPFPSLDVYCEEGFCFLRLQVLSLLALHSCVRLCHRRCANIGSRQLSRFCDEAFVRPVGGRFGEFNV